MKDVSARNLFESFPQDWCSWLLPPCHLVRGREMIVSNVLALERRLLRQIKTLVVNVSHCDKVLNISNPKWGRIPAIKQCCKHAPALLHPSHFYALPIRTAWSWKADYLGKRTHRGCDRP